MEDIDRTFLKLKRLDFDSLIHKIKNGPRPNPLTYVLEYTEFSEETCIENGWTLKELNTELYKRLYVK